MRGQLSGSSEVKQALTKAEECEKRMLAAKSEEDRVFYDRMCRKWIGVAALAKT